MKKKTALITGVTGQDGSYLTDFLLKKNYKIIGVKRRSSSFNTKRIDHIYNDLKQAKNFIPYYGDLTDSSNILRIIQSTQPDEIYNLGAQSHVHTSFEIPEYSANADALGTLRLLEAIRLAGIEKDVKFYNASTSELFGKVVESPQKETTPFYPRSPYGVAKLYGFWITKNYRESYNMFATNGILFNHESPRRGPTFVTRKITKGLNMILKGERDKLVMGNLDAKRDWGHAKDYVEGMWRILQADEPNDYVLSTNEFHSVREFIEKSFAIKGFNIKWKGSGLDEIGYDENTGRELIFVSEKYFRPAEVEELLGDSTKAREELGWKPQYSFDDLVQEMVDQDCK